MFRRFTAFFLAVCFSLALVVVAVPARAIGGSDLMIASAVLSFLSSAGVHLWRDFSGAYDDDVLAVNMKADISQVWDEYTDFDPSVPAFDNLIDGISVHDGNWIYNYDTALTLQGFTDWLANRLDNKVGVSQELLGGFEVPGTGGDYSADNGFKIYEVATSPTPVTWSDGTFYMSEPVGTYRSGGVDYPVVLRCTYPTGNYFSWYAHAGKIAEYTLFDVFHSQIQFCYYNPDRDLYYQLSFFSAPSDLTDTFKLVLLSDGYTSRTMSPAFQTSVPIGSLTFSDLTHNPGSGALEAGDLLGRLASTVADQTFNLVKPKYDETTGEVISPGQDLAISVGATTDADADDLIADALARYIAQAETDALTEPIAHPVPIEGESIAYPQPVTEDIVVDGQSLTFSDLGPMLTSRFPFCIPWDFADLFNTLVVPAKPINTRIDIVPQAWRAKYHITGDTSFQLDLTTDNWILLRKIIAWGFLFGACGELILLTKSAIWTA